MGGPWHMVNLDQDAPHFMEEESILSGAVSEVHQNPTLPSMEHAYHLNNCNLPNQTPNRCWVQYEEMIQRL